MARDEGSLTQLRRGVLPHAVLAVLADGERYGGRARRRAVSRPAPRGVRGDALPAARPVAPGRPGRDQLARVERGAARAATTSSPPQGWPSWPPSGPSGPRSAPRSTTCCGTLRRERSTPRERHRVAARRLPRTVASGVRPGCPHRCATSCSTTSRPTSPSSARRARHRVHARGTRPARLAGGAGRRRAPRAHRSRRHRRTGGPGPPAWVPPPAPRPQVRALDVTAVVLLLLGGVILPVVGWVIGVVLCGPRPRGPGARSSSARSWSPAGWRHPFALLLLGGQTCSYIEVTDEATGVDRRARAGVRGVRLRPVVRGPAADRAARAPGVVAAFLLRRARPRRGRDAGVTG